MFDLLDSCHWQLYVSRNGRVLVLADGKTLYSRGVGALESWSWSCGGVGRY
jgi:hypothetical protein